MMMVANLASQGLRNPNPSITRDQKPSHSPLGLRARLLSTVRPTFGQQLRLAALHCLNYPLNTGSGQWTTPFHSQPGRVEVKHYFAFYGKPFWVGGLKCLHVFELIGWHRSLDQECSENILSHCIVCARCSWKGGGRILHCVLKVGAMECALGLRCIVL